jgi:hypothetical protein
MYEQISFLRRLLEFRLLLYFNNYRKCPDESRSYLTRVNNIHDRLCGLVARVPGYRTEMYFVSCEVQTEFIYVMLKIVERLCGLVVRVPSYRMEIYCVSCEVRTEFIYIM